MPDAWHKEGMFTDGKQLRCKEGQNWRVSGDWGSYGAFSQAEFELTAEYPSGSALKQLTPRSRI